MTQPYSAGPAASATEVGSVAERARALLDAIAAQNDELRCYVAVDEDEVLREAVRLDAVPPSERGPLHGITLGVKDIIDVAGLPTRAGSSFYQRNPGRDAPVVAALRAAGALLVGKTNTHEFAWGITTENPHFGRARNPWDHARVAGGSSGGSGAAVAAGLADVALGTDTLGSIRIPAAVNGISGFRPATGALSIDDIFPLAIGLDTVGPLARDLDLVQRCYEVMGGGAITAAQPQHVARLRGGAWDRVERDVTGALDAAADALRSLGVDVVDVPWWDDDLVAAIGTLQQRAAADVHRPYFAQHREEYGEDVRARVEAALGVGEAAGQPAREAVARARATWNEALRGYGAALAPSVGREAPIAPAPASFRVETIPLVTPASAFGLPVAAVPIGFGRAGMPLGMQIIAADGSAATAFALGSAYQRATDWHQQRPATT